MTDLTQLINTAETCHKEVALEYFTAFTGQKDNLEVVALMAKYPELFTRETLDGVTAATTGNGFDERRGRFLRAVFTGNYFSDQLKSKMEKLVNTEGNTMVSFDGEEFPYRAVPVMLGNEADRSRRLGLDNANIAATDSMNPLRREITGRAQEITRELGYANTIDLCEKVSNMRIYPLRDLLTKFLSETEGIYAERLNRYANDFMGVERSELGHSDIPYLMRASKYDHMFPEDDMVPSLSRTLKGIGIDLDNQTNIMMDLKARPKKSPRAFCIGIDVPHDVRLVISPHGGQDDYSTLFHEAGHLQFGAHMSADLDYLYRQHGDTSVHESYAFLLQHLVDNPLWWKLVMKADPEGYPEFARFNRLYMLRRYSSKLHYEVEFHEQGGGEEMAEAYSNWLSSGCLIPYPKERYLSDFDDGFYVVEYLQAWIWEVQLRSHLINEFDEAWFTVPAAGDFLRDLWKDGQKFDVWEIAAKLGFDGLNTGPLTEELTK